MRQERRGGDSFRKKDNQIMQMATRPVGIPVPGRTAPDVTPQPKRKKEGQRLSTRAKMFLASSAIAAILGGGYASYETIPQVNTAINKIIGQEEIPPTFDNNIVKQKIGNNNIKRVTPEEANKQDLLTPKFREKTLTLISPFILPQDSSASLDKSPYEVRGINHNEPRFIVPAGTEIVLPKGMHYILIAGNPEWDQDPNLVYGISAVTYNEQTNTSIHISLYFYDDRAKKDLPVSTSLRKTPRQEVIYPNFSSFPDWKNLPTSDGKTPLGVTNTDQLIHVYTNVFNGTNYSTDGSSSGSEITNIQTQWQQQDGKLLIIKSSHQ